MLFRRRGSSSPKPDPITKLIREAELNSRSVESILGEGEHVLDLMEALVLISIHRARRQLTVSTYGGQRRDAVDMFRDELSRLQDFIEELSLMDPPLPGPEIDARLTAFVAGSGGE